MAELNDVLQRIDADFDGAVARWSELLRIPSVSTDPDYAGETRRAGEWVRDQLADLGFRAELRDTPGHPMVVAHYDGPAGAPHVLYYGHYDVQPPDPLEEWQHGPFEPTVVDGPRGKRMLARGAVDDKGQAMTFIEAFRAWRAVHGTLPIRVTVFFEGEEECGSPSLPPFLEDNRAELTADVAVVSDTPGLDVDTPALTTQLRGLLYTELTVKGPSHDLHSGLYGGAAPNPLNALARVLGRLHDDDGRVQIPGFYDDVVEPDAETLRQWQDKGPSERAVLESIGVDAAGGEAGRHVLEKLWSRPTCDVNGVLGGYTGAGQKTVIAAKGSAKVSFRLVPDQDPARILAGFKDFVAANLPPGCAWSVDQLAGAPAIRVPTESPYLQAALEALERVYGKTPAMIGCGGSIPVVGMFKDTLGVDTLLMGFGLDDDRMHSPNEKFELRCFENGIKSHAALLDRLQGLGARKQAAE